MLNNPDNVPPGDATWDVARAQGDLMGTIAFKVIIDFALCGVVSQSPYAAIPPSVLVILLCSLPAAYGALRLAKPMYGTAAAMAWAGLTLLPGLGIVSALVLNGLAIDYLRGSGIRTRFVGLTKQDLERLRPRNAAFEISSGEI